MDENRDVGVIYTGRSPGAQAPSITPHAVPLPPVIGGTATSPGAAGGSPGLAPIVTRGGSSAVPELKPTAINPESITIIGLNSNNNPTSGAYAMGDATGATPIPSILRQPQASQSVDPSLPRLRALPVKEFLVGKSHFFVIGASVVASIMYIASWGAALAYENNGKLQRRHIASIIGFVFQIVTTVAVVAAMRIEPTLWVLYGLQAMALITLFLTTVGMGMNNVIVDICTAGNHDDQKILCPAHYAEFFAAFFVSIGMVLVFFATQQRIAVLIDKGILSNIRGRMTQL